MIKKAFIVFLIAFVTLYGQVAAQYKITLTDASTNLPIPYANVYFPNSKTGTASDVLGKFTINTTNSEVFIRISCIGYETFLGYLSLSDKDLSIQLEPSTHQLQEITVSAGGSHLQGENVMNVEQLDIATINNSGVSIADRLTSIAGIDNMSTGIGIGKPLVRGLGANRIAIYSNGIRLENQQWGDEHGLSIGEEGLGQVEIIKGAASVFYGSDALGGVLFFTEEPYAKQNTFAAKVASEYNTNTNGWHNAAKVKFSTNRWHYNIYTALTNHNDYHDGSNARIVNSAFNSKDVKGSLGYSGNKFTSSVNYSFLNEQFGLTEGEEEESQKILMNYKALFKQPDAPYQNLNTHIVSTENHFFLSNSASIKFNAGFITNRRQEFEDLNAAALDMTLNTFNYNLRLTVPHLKKISLTVGSQGMYQTNTNAGEENLIPDATTKDIGLYSMIEYKYAAKAYIQFGARIDGRNIKADANINNSILLSYGFDKFYPAFSASAGIYQPFDNGFDLRIFSSTGFRTPNTFELCSYGVHEGTYRFEIGNQLLKTEKAIQLDAALSYNSDHLEVEINPFINHINDYIFLKPSGEIKDDLPVYYYLQTNALLYGGEAALHYHPHRFHWLHFESSYDCVFGKDEANNYLPLIPAQKIKTEISVAFSFKKLSNIGFYLQNIYAFPQNSVSNFEYPTSDYDVVNAGITATFKAFKQAVQFDLRATNLFNVRYFEHTSRYRSIGVANVGRNVMFRISVPVEFNTEKIN
ncbi:MAG: TonB-dependent receptor [Bacteroidales bacterium]|jgi:iron complex outermembrane receptor protein|nr:TonB-dependent receptor [Bacteroidales bacterium]